MRLTPTSLRRARAALVLGLTLILGQMSINLDNQTENGTASGTQLTTTHVCAGANRILFSAIAIKKTAAQVGTTALYGTAPLSQLASVESGGGNNVRVELWYLLNPPSGSADVESNISAAARFCQVNVSFTGANHIASPLTLGQTTGTSIAQSIASAVGELCLDAAVKFNANDAMAVQNSMQTLVGDFPSDASTGMILSLSTEPGAPNVSMGWTWGISLENAQIILPIRPSRTAFVAGCGVS